MERTLHQLQPVEMPHQVVEAVGYGFALTLASLPPFLLSFLLLMTIQKPTSAWIGIFLP